MSLRPESLITLFDSARTRSGRIQTSLPPVCLAAAARAKVDGDTPGETSTMSFDFMPAAKADMNSLLSGSCVLQESHRIL